VTSWRRALPFLAAWSVAGASQAQSIEQISPAPASADMPLNPPESGASVESAPQLSSGAESAPAAAQVNRERRSARAPDQLSKGPRTAQSSQPLSDRADGRPEGVQRLAGTDACDPARRHLPKSQCARIIENRSSEFARRDPTALSPEQRLLLEQQIGREALDPVSGARRLATTGAADESLAAMGVAAVVMGNKDDPPEKSKQDEDVAKAAEVVGAILNQPLAPPPQ
jgi:hypothetical protein